VKSERQKVENLPPPQRMALYEKAIKLREKKGWGSWKIADELGICRSTVTHWIYHGTSPENSLTIPNLEPSSDLSYIIGVKLSDGYTSQGEAFKIFAKDRDFVENVRNCISKILKRRPAERDKSYKIWWCPSSEMWAVEMGSQWFASFLSKEPKAFEPIMKEFPSDFLRGLFDGDGSSYKEEGHLLRIQLGNTNQSVINLAERALSKIGIDCRIYETDLADHPEAKKETYYKLLIDKQEDARKFGKRVGTSIKRKRVWEEN